MAKHVTRQNHFVIVKFKKFRIQYICKSKLLSTRKLNLMYRTCEKSKSQSEVCI